jgi:hypothetical protein
VLLLLLLLLWRHKWRRVPRLLLLRCVGLALVHVLHGVDLR